MTNFLTNFLDANDLLYNSQFGFRNNHCTSHVIITLIERISRALDTGEIVCGIFIDFSKAFDVIPHKTLLKKLYAYGIRGEIYNWFKSYLSDRSQFVQYQNSKSGTKPITHGVLQSSILGPLLFILYINDFSNASKLLFKILFADDTSVFIEGYQYDKMIEILNKKMKKIDTWLECNGLVINTYKTHYMVFHGAKFKYTNKDIYIFKILKLNVLQVLKC